MSNQIYVKTLEVAGIASALQAMRLPMKSGDKSDSELKFLNPRCQNWSDEEGLYFNIQYPFTEICIGNKDIQLLQKLIRSGDEHAKIMRGIVVWAELNLPRYIWQEMDTYTVGVLPLCSESTMHCEARGLSGEELEKFKSELKEGHIQKRIRAFTYQTLGRMRNQRKNHRLPTWRNIIIPWIDNLPMANELIIIERQKNI